MRGVKPFLYLFLGCLVCAILSGCAGSVPQNGPSGLVISQIGLAEGVPGLAYKQLLIASGGLTPYTWTVSAGSLPPGLSLTTDGIISGTPTTTGAFSFTVQCVDSQTPTKAGATQGFMITINPPLSLASVTLASGQVGGSYGQSIVAANGVQPYAYEVAYGSLPPCAPNPPCTNGLMTLTTNPQPMGGGANNATIATPVGGALSNAGVFNFTIQATDALGEVATATFSITVTGRLQGNYAFSFNGFEENPPKSGQYQPVYLVGSFVADGNGNITSGVMDQAGPGSQSFTDVPLKASTYNVPTGSNIATINLASGLGTYGLAAALSTNNDSSFIMTNSTIWGSGLLKKQTTFSLPTNASSYAFGLFGSDASGIRYAGAGMFTLSSLNITAGAEDTNDGGTPSGELPIASGTMGSPNGNTGRGTLTLNINGQAYNYAYYTTVSTTNELIAVETDDGGPQTIVTLLPQEAGGITGSFSNTSLTCKGPGACVVIQQDGLNSSGPDASIGVATFDGNGNITRTGIDSLPGYFTDENNAGTASQNSYDGTYSVDSTCGSITTACGRVTVTLTSNGQPIQYQPIWYLVTKNQAFTVGTDPAVSSGQFSPQSGAPYQLLSLLGSFLGGTVDPTSQSVTNETDVAGTPPPGGVWAVIYDSNGPGKLQTNQTFNGPYVFDPTYGKAFGRFEVTTTSGQLVSVLYVVSTGSAGVTGAPAGLIGLNVGQYNGKPDPNPRVSQYSR
ncbi:MAG: Ig domain-containing protein [Candidatus Korobacteraceae bacterium]